jgi:hypothetical protein
VRKEGTQFTIAAYSAFQAAYDFFNTHLFDGVLPSCLITLQRRRHTLGYFCPGRFHQRGSDGVVTDEIALNPDGFVGEDDREILSTLVHEQAHLWQAHFGTRQSRGGYHNREWANQMLSIGLVPSDTGEPNGRMTGQRMSHYILPGGLFDEGARELLGTGFRLIWESGTGIPRGLSGTRRRTADPSKIKFSCLLCGQNAWAKQSAHLICGLCNREMLTL